MKSKLYFMSTIALVLSSCSKQQATVSVTIPARTSAGVPSFASSLAVVGGELPPPMSLGDINCIAVNVIAKDIPSASWDRGSTDSQYSSQQKAERALAGEPCAYGGITTKVVPYVMNQPSTQLSLNVPVGSDRVFQLLGFKAPPGTCSAPMDAGTFFSQFTSKVTPNELGRSIANVSGAMTLNLSGRFDPARNMDRCSLEGGGPFFQKMPLTVSLTPGMEPKIVSVAGNTYVAVYVPGSSELRVYRWDSSGVNIVGVANGGTSVLSFDVGVLSTGAPVVTYSYNLASCYTSFSYCSKVMTFDGATWVPINGSWPDPVYGNNPLDQCKLDVGSGDYVSVACREGSSNAVKAAYVWSGGSSNYGGTVPVMTATGSLKFKIIGGNPTVAFANGSYVYVHQAPSFSWGGTSMGAFNGAAPSPLSIQLGRLGPANQPIVSWTDGASILMNDYFNQSSWTGVQNVPYLVSWSAMVMDSDMLGNTYFLIQENGDLVLKSSGNWMIQSAPFSLMGGPSGYLPMTPTSIAMAVDGTSQKAHIVYQNLNSELVFAKP